MVDITLLETDLSSNPGIQVVVGSLAQVRTYFSSFWIADCGGDNNNASWAYINNRMLPGFTQAKKWRATVYFTITSLTTPGGNGRMIYGMHGPIPDNPLGTGDNRQNTIGVEIRHSPTLNNIRFRPIVYNSAGTRHQGTESGNYAFAGQKEIVFEWDGVDTLSIEYHATPGGAITWTSSVVMAAGTLDLLTIFGIRDAITTSAGYQLFGHADYVKLEWLDAPDDEWVISVPNAGTIVLESAGVWNKDQTPRETIIDAQGRNWASVYHDGAGPANIILTGTLLRDTCAELDEVDEILFQAKTTGAIVALYSPYTYFSITDGKIGTWVMRHETARTTNRDYLLVVKSRREPQIT